MLQALGESRGRQALFRRQTPEVLEALRSHPLGTDAAIIGTCGSDHPGRLVLDTGLGRRLLTEPVGEPLPRIC